MKRTVSLLGPDDVPRSSRRGPRLTFPEPVVAAAKAAMHLRIPHHLISSTSGIPESTLKNWGSGDTAARVQPDMDFARTLEETLRRMFSEVAR